ncbi:MAG: transcription termination factor Rho, partial [Verrucomicrobiota bacterium]
STPEPKKKIARKSVRRGSARKKPADEDSTVEEPIPETFSADPDDMDDYGDRDSQEARAEQSDAKHQDEDAAGASADKAESAEVGESGGESAKGQHQGNKPGGQKHKNGKGWQPKNKAFQKKHAKQNFQQGGKKQKFKQTKKGFFQPSGGFAASSDDDFEPPVYDSLPEDETLKTTEAFETLKAEKTASDAEPVDYTGLSKLTLPELEEKVQAFGATWEGAPTKKKLLRAVLNKATSDNIPVKARGIVELADTGYGFLVQQHEQYRVLEGSAFVHACHIERYGLQRGHVVDVLLHAPREGETCPFVIGIEQVMDKAPDEVQHLAPFTELVPYYPLDRILLECNPDDSDWDNNSMRIVDLLTPIGLGQRGLIVAPPRTGKTVLLQAMANAITVNRPDVHLIILLIDERPEEVTDFRRQVETAEVISSTFDESAESHVHAAEMVIEKSRRMVESGQDVVILLDSITRLARAYNTLMPSSGKILSGGVEAGALQKPKRFFGSARNIEGGGSLTILGTALVETGSKMDEVIFEEFKGTGNMELHLDRELVNKRIFPALNFEKSGTRKEELLYHPHEMDKIYGLRRAMKGVPSTEAMEMLISRIKKTKTNAEFLMAMGR